jgi:hypothetical protein
MTVEEAEVWAKVRRYLSSSEADGKALEVLLKEVERLKALLNTTDVMGE